jgi:Tfp pilus assembly protein PilF
LNPQYTAVRLTKQKSGEEATALYAQAGEKYEAGLRIKPDQYWSLNNWGLALAAQAKQTSGAEADRLLAQVGEKFEAALRIKPDGHEALNNWGTALREQSQQKSGAGADRLVAQAGEKSLQAEELVPGHGAYSLACVSSLQGSEQECRT